MPDTITEFLQLEIDRAIAAMSSDRARLHFLTVEQGKWALRMRTFYRTGEQPFGGPHPEYGPMAAGDFLVVFGMIHGARAKIERSMEAAQ